jgi:hypothetical protein
VLYIKDIFADSILPLAAAIILGSRYNSLPAALKILFYYLLLSSIIFSISNYLADRVINNLFLYHLYTVFNFCCITFYLQSSFFLFKNKRLLYLLLATVVLFCVANTLFWEKFTSFDTNALIFTNTLLVILCLWSMIKSISDHYLLENLAYSSLIIMFAFFVYSSSSTLVFCYFKYISNYGKKVSNDVWFFHDNIIIFKNCCLILASILWVKKN